MLSVIKSSIGIVGLCLGLAQAATLPRLTLGSPSKTHAVEVSLAPDGVLPARILRGGVVVVRDLAFGNEL